MSSGLSPTEDPDLPAARELIRLGFARRRTPTGRRRDRNPRRRKLPASITLAVAVTRRER